ncbi:MAG: ABC transporter ATP-binding protein, partial [Gammaproteobacteria bacterium]|nr:ABC transporter ATP-binding protein [Gammaproteobacteria bacterium]
MFFNWLEYLVDPLERSDALQPPEEIGAFFGFYLWPMHRLILATLFFTGVAAVSEIYLYSFLGDIVDWMATSQPETFFEVHSTQLLVMMVVIAIIRPLSTIVSRAVINLSLAPGLANRVRWQNYRYVLRQSLSYF